MIGYTVTNYNLLKMSRLFSVNEIYNIVTTIKLLVYLTYADRSLLKMLTNGWQTVGHF